MRITLAAYVYVKREEGRSVHVCQTMRGRKLSSRDPLLGTALSKLGNKARKFINDWIREGRVNRFSPWLYDPATQCKITKLNLVLRDRTLHWKLLLVYTPAFDRWIVHSPSVPDVVFEVTSMAEIDLRASEVYNAHAQSLVNSGETGELESHSDMWLEPLELDVETAVDKKKKAKNIFAALFGGEKMTGSAELHKVGQCLDDLADNFEPTIGREDQVNEVDRMLRRDDRQGVLLVGPRAVGKTAIVHECVSLRADRVRDKKGTKPQVWALSPQRLISGMSYLGQWEQRWLAILREATRRDHVLYFDDLVGLFTAGRTRDSSLSAADVLRSYLAENDVRILVESTPEQLAVLRRRDRALADHFHLVHVPSWNHDDALPVVMQSMYNAEQSSQRFFHPEVLPLVMRHQEIYSPNRAFPGKAIEMTKTLAKQVPSAVGRDTFFELAGTQVGANMQLMLGLLGNQEAIRGSLSQSLIGQPAAVEAMSKVVLRFSQHLQATDRPLGVLLFLGPTGVGKTESVKVLTRLLYRNQGSDSHLVRIDMNELTTPFAAEQLVGTFEQPDGRLTAAVRRRPNCIILLDEIEKAHPDVFDYLLQVIGEGRLTDARGRIADFRSAIIVMTSNLGAAEQESSVGFDRSSQRRSQIYLKAAKSFFRPEFFNRIDEVVAFRSLESEDMNKIVRLQMQEVLARDGLRRRDVFVRVAESAIQRVIESGFDPQLGARAVRRKIEREVIGPLGDCLAALPLEKPALVQVLNEPPAPELKCRVTELQVYSKTTPPRMQDLEQIVESSVKLYATLDERLNALRDDLAAQDRAAGESIEDASYYALKEQLHHCDDLVKMAKARILLDGEPTTLRPSTPTNWKSPGGDPSKRAMRELQSFNDLQAAIRDSENPHRTFQWTPEHIGKGLIENFALAASMIEHANAPRSWLLGLQRVTQPEDPTIAETVLDVDFLRRSTLDVRTGMHSGDPNAFTSRLAKCLQHEWQYDVSPVVLPEGFWLVSGISVFGLLSPLLGTYRIEMTNSPTDFGVLRALPLPSDWKLPISSEELTKFGQARHTSANIDAQVQSVLQELERLRAIVRSESILSETSGLKTPDNQTIPTDNIRGLIREDHVSDYVSGEEATLPVGYWIPLDKILPLQIKWWKGCLQTPDAFLLDNPVVKDSGADGRPSDKGEA